MVEAQESGGLIGAVRADHREIQELFGQVSTATAKDDKVDAELDDLEVDDPSFECLFGHLRQEVLAHAEREEQEEHPLIIERTASGQLDRLASVFNVAEVAAPTRPHPERPQSAKGDAAVGLFVVVADRVRDALREGMEKIRS